MPRDPEALIDIATAIRRILRYTNGISRFDLEANDEKLSEGEAMPTKLMQQRQLLG